MPLCTNTIFNILSSMQFQKALHVKVMLTCKISYYFLP